MDPILTLYPSFLAIKNQSQVNLKYQKEIVNAKSLLGILMLAAERGSKIDVEAEGEDAENAVASILDLAKNRFNIRY